MKELVKRVMRMGAVKGINAQDKTIVAYASTNEWDRYGERFEADAFKDGLDNYKKNPVVLFAHDYTSPPIGKAVGFEFDMKGLILEMKFADTPMANDIFALYEGGFMNAFSVGFRPLEVGFEERIAGSGEMGAVFKKAELLENSAVPVPANPGALVKSGMLSIAQRVLCPTLAVPEEWNRFEKWMGGPSLSPEMQKAVADGNAPDLRTALEYLIGLGKMLRHKGKIQDEDLRSLLMQTNNVCRELIYGPAAAKLEAGDGPLTDDEVDSMIKEFEVLSEMAKITGAGPEAISELAKIGELIEKTICGK